MALQSTGSVQGLPGQMGKVRAESRYSAIALINLDEKQTGAPSAGNPHAGCEVAGAGTRLTVRILRHFQRKREATDRLNLRGNGASPRPYPPTPSSSYAFQETSAKSAKAVCDVEPCISPR